MKLNVNAGLWRVRGHYLILTTFQYGEHLTKNRRQFLSETSVVRPLQQSITSKLN
jgi:hypothetical protein